LQNIHGLNRKST